MNKKLIKHAMVTSLCLILIGGILGTDCPGGPPSPDDLDSDNDGVLIHIDECPYTAPDQEVNEVGCAESDFDDADEDGVTNGVDECPETPPGDAVDGGGCSESQKDDDVDGVANDIDRCPDTEQYAEVDEVGCSESEKDDDLDGDGVANDVDECPDTPPGEGVDEVGCAESEKDDDEDGVTNDVDDCPDTPAGTVVDEFGCEIVDVLDGKYEGTTSEGKEMSFVVADGAVLAASVVFSTYFGSVHVLHTWVPGLPVGSTGIFSGSDFGGQVHADSSATGSASRLQTVTWNAQYTGNDIEVPDCVGLVQEDSPNNDAELKIRFAGFVSGEVTQEYSASVPAGKVISQAPPAGELRGAGTEVSLVVSLGP